MLFLSSSLVQSVERRTVNPYVAGSSPVGGAKTLRDKISQELIFLCLKIPVTPSLKFRNAAIKYTFDVKAIDLQ